MQIIPKKQLLFIKLILISYLFTPINNLNLLFPFFFILPKNLNFFKISIFLIFSVFLNFFYKSKTISLIPYKRLNLLNHLTPIMTFFSFHFLSFFFMRLNYFFIFLIKFKNFSNSKQIKLCFFPCISLQSKFNILNYYIPLTSKFFTHFNIPLLFRTLFYKIFKNKFFIFNRRKYLKFKQLKSITNLLTSLSIYLFFVWPLFYFMFPAYFLFSYHKSFLRSLTDISSSPEILYSYFKSKLTLKPKFFIPQFFFTQNFTSLGGIFYFSYKMLSNFFFFNLNFFSSLWYYTLTFLTIATLYFFKN